jgi:hypothetical protein
VLLLRLPPPFKAREQCVGFLRLDLGMVYKTFSTPRQQNAGMMDAATEARWNAWGSVPRGEAGTLHRDGAPYVAIVCGTEVFHHAADRWPDAVDVALLGRYARAFANGALQLASRII